MVMRQMRENTKWIMLATALAFVALMVFEWGMDLTGRSGTQLSGGEAGRVNGEAITYEEYTLAYRNLYAQQSQGGLEISPAMNAQIEDAAWDQLVTERLLRQEMHRRGIEVSAEEIRQAARFAPPAELMNSEMFQTDGQFDITKYHAFLASPAMPPEQLLQLEAYYRDVIPRSKLFFQTTAGIHVTDAELWRMWQDTREAVRIRFIPFDPTALVPEGGVSVTEAEVRAYYTAHEDDFLRPAQATVRYVMLDTRPAPADTAEARERAGELRDEIVAGADFASVAQREMTAGPALEPGAETRMVRGQILPALEEAAFNTPVGSVSEPVPAPSGFTLLKVEGRQADTARVRQLTIPIELNRAAENDLLAKADSIEDLAEDLPLSQIADRLGLEVREAEILPGLTFVPGLGLAEDGVHWVFSEAEPGEVGPVFDAPGALYVFELVERQDARTLTFEEARSAASAAVLTEKRIEAAKVRAREAVDRVRAGESLENVATAFDTRVEEAGPFTRADFVPSLGRLTPAIGAAFGLRSGETSGLVESDRGLYIIQVVERQDADRAEWEAQKAEQRAAVTEALAQQVWGEFLAALRENAEIIDQRRALERQMAQS